MTNGELFIRENPTVETKINGSCVWIYFDGVNHYTMPTSWWEQEISLFDKIKTEINAIEISGQIDEHTMFVRSADGVKEMVLNIIDKYRNEVGE